jgi:hypothetical protein
MNFQASTSGKTIDEQTVAVPLEPEHYRMAGSPFSPFSGIPAMEAYKIVNNLNRNQDDHQFVYHLAEWLNGQVR